MTGVSPIDRAKPVPRARRTGWFARAAIEVHCEDQEAEVRSQLYAKPAESLRTVRRVERVEPVRPAERFERIERDPEFDRIDRAREAENFDRIGRDRPPEHVERSQEAAHVERQIERVADRPAA
jgi:hypothetical protein